jgi:hypothetical protein
MMAPQQVLLSQLPVGACSSSKERFDIYETIL